MSEENTGTCWQCGKPISAGAYFCPNCGAPKRNAPGGSVPGDTPRSHKPERQEPAEILLSGGKHLHVSDDMFALRELITVVEEGIAWWEKHLREAEGVSRAYAATVIGELSQVLESLSQQIAQGQETAQITARLPSQRRYSVGCPVCGRGNRAGARFCSSCGSLLPSLTKPQTRPLTLRYAGQSDTGQVRENNEDTWYTGVLPLATGATATLLLVADGMGGAKAGEAASALASTVMQQQLAHALASSTPDSDETWQDLLHQAALEANRQIYAQAQRHEGKRGMGTTLTAVLLVGSGEHMTAHMTAHMVHIGDSRYYLFNPGGVSEDGRTWLQLSTDHTLIARLIDIGQITTEEARHMPQRNMLYRALGVEAVVEGETSSHRLNSDDMLLLCSDGLIAHVEGAELARVVLAASTPEQACEQLIHLANSRGGKDNISVIVAKFEQSQVTSR